MATDAPTLLCLPRAAILLRIPGGFRINRPQYFTLTNKAGLGWSTKQTADITWTFLSPGFSATSNPVHLNPHYARYARLLLKVLPSTSPSTWPWSPHLWGKILWNIYSPKKQSDTGKGCPAGRGGGHHPWRFSRAMGMWHWGTRAVGIGIWEGFLNLNDTTVATAHRAVHTSVWEQAASHHSPSASRSSGLLQHFLHLGSMHTETYFTT